MTDRIVLIGHPVGHSRSPAMMTAAFRAAGIDAAYELRDTPPRALEGTLAALLREGVRGANVTVPWKVATMALVRPDGAARACGAVNTLVRDDCGFAGSNTDVEGFTTALAASGASLRGAVLAVLGAGGASRAVVAAARAGGASKVTLLARAASRDDAAAPMVVLGTDAAHDALAEATLVVQATPCGMHGGPAVEGLLVGARLDACRTGTLAVDLVYAPTETAWMRAADAAGLRVLRGFGAEMLVQQGVAAVQRWFGVRPPAEPMREAVWGAH